MKKILAMILVLFVLSISPAYSQDTAGTTDSAIVKEPTPGQVSPNQLKENMQEKRQEVRKNMQEKKENVRENMQEKRERVRSLVESKIKDTPAYERNKLLRVSETVEGTDAFVEKLSKEDVEKFSKLSRSEQISIIRENRPELLQKIKVMKITDEEFKSREISREKIRESVMNYKEARKDAKEVRDGLKETRDAVKNAQTDEEKIATAKDYLTKMVDAEIAELTSLKERVQNNQDITSEESANSITRIDNAITALNELKTKISSATTLQELRDISKDIKKHAMIRHIHKTRAVAANICNGVLKRSEHIEKKAEAALAKAEERGSDTTTLNSQIGELSTLLETAKTQCADAKTAFESAKNAEDVEAKKTAVKSFIEATKKAAETVREAHKKLVEIRSTAKSLNLDVDAEKVEEIAETEGGENA
ncbi:hypothetical protein HYT57_02750 [Candidatus Woesearchaeota archaeon]|nr:hypothetical protein [Candidatus Woesearchaeota archaeon]